jgi:hypothetical protein
VESPRTRIHANEIERKGGEDAMAKHKVWLPGYVYAYSPWFGYYPHPTWQEYEITF